MNKFIYFHALKDSPVKHAIINKAFDLGILPVDPNRAENYAVISVEIINDSAHFVLVNFGKDKEKLTKFIKESKAMDMILFTYYPLSEDTRAYPMTQLNSDFFTDCYSIVGRVDMSAHELDTTRGIIETLGVDLQLQLTPVSQLEAFLADVGFADYYENMRHLFSRGVEHDFLAMNYDVDTSNELPQLKYIILGSNSDYLRVGNNNKYFWAACTYPAAKGRGGKSVRDGSIMGGNVIKIDFQGSAYNPEFTVMESAFAKPKNITSYSDYQVATPRVLNIHDELEAKKLMLYDHQLKVFTHYVPKIGKRTTWEEFNKNHLSPAVHHHRTTIDDFAENLNKTLDDEGRHGGRGYYDSPESMGFSGESGRWEKTANDEQTKKVIVMKIT